MMLKRTQLSQMAKRTAATIKKSQPKNMLTPQQQLAKYKERLAKGAVGFQDILDEHGPNGLQRYLRAMLALEKK